MSRVFRPADAPDHGRRARAPAAQACIFDLGVTLTFSSAGDARCDHPHANALSLRGTRLVTMLIGAVFASVKFCPRFTSFSAPRRPTHAGYDSRLSAQCSSDADRVLRSDVVPVPPLWVCALFASSGRQGSGHRAAHDRGIGIGPRMTDPRGHHCSPRFRAQEPVAPAGDGSRPREHPEHGAARLREDSLR